MKTDNAAAAAALRGATLAFRKDKLEQVGQRAEGGRNRRRSCCRAQW